MNRRSFLRGLVAAPAIVPIGSLMPIRGIIMPTADWVTESTRWADKTSSEIMIDIEDSAP